MTGFRLLLAAMLVIIVGYTSVTIANHGANLIPVFFGDIKEMAWPGQFNLDFLCFLILSGLWVAWRHHFKPKGLLLAPIATLGGMLFLSVYLLWLTFKTKGDMKVILLGEHRAG